MNYKEPIILLDADGVLFDFTTPYLAFANEVSGLNITLDTITSWEMEKLYPLEVQHRLHAKSRGVGFCEKLQPYPGAIKAVAALRKLGKVYCVTAPCLAPTWAYERTLALLEHFGFTPDEVVHTKAKHLVRGKLFVDDKTENVAAWAEANPGGIGVIWKSLTIKLKLT